MSENNEEIETYSAQDLEMLNTKEATTEFCSRAARILYGNKKSTNSLYIQVEIAKKMKVIYYHSTYSVQSPFGREGLEIEILLICC